MGLYRRRDSRFWWMSYTWKGEQHFESTKSRSKALAKKILNKREGEIAMQLFKVGQQGERMSFKELCTEFESAHVPKYYVFMTVSRQPRQKKKWPSPNE